MRRRWLLLAALAPLCGCTLAPPYHRPPLPTPATVANSRGPVASAPVLQPWRAFFGDPRLTAVIGQAIANNRDLASAVANVQVARASWLIQRSQLFPTIGAQTGATLAKIPYSVAFGENVPGAYSEHIYTAEATASYQLDLFGEVRSQTKAALEQYFATAEARRAAQISIVGQVAQEWLTLAADRTLVGVAGDTLAEAGSSLKLTRAMFDRGEAAQSDVDQAESLLAQAKYSLGAATTQEAQDKDSLDLLVGASVADSLLPNGIDDESKVMGELPTGVSSKVLLDRPDVLEAEHQLEADNADIGAARAAFFPQISLTGDYGVTSIALASLFAPASLTWTFAPQLTQPIFEGGKLRASLKQAKAQRAMAEAAYEKAIQTAFREVADALAQRGQIDAELSAQETMTRTAADAVRLSEAEFRRGTASYLDVLSAERTLFSAEQTLATTRLLKATNLVALYQALGGGID